MRKVLSSLIVLALLLTTLLAGDTKAYALGPIVDPALSSALTTAQPTDQLRVIATFDSPLSALQQSTLLGLVTDGKVLQRLPMALLLATPTEINAVRALPGLRSLYLDKQLSYVLHESVPLIGADRAWNELGIDGTGVTVAVVDSGVDATHPDLPMGDTVIKNVKLVGQGDLLPSLIVPVELVNTDTSSGHGTHVAGTVAGSGAASGGYFTGVAPGADLVGIGTGDVIFIFTALAAFDYVLANQEALSIDIVTNSWGTGGAFDPNDPVNVGSKALYDAGMVVLFAAGNEGPGNDTLNPYSVAPWVIGVAAGNKDGQTLADFSSRGRPGDGLYHPTITAPGAGIVAARSLNTVLPVLAIGDDANINPAWAPYYTTMSGTSMATPHAAGVAALILQANPGLTPDAVKQLMVDTATPMPLYGEYAAGAGYIDAFDAVSLAGRVKRIKKHRTKDGKEIEVYVVGEQLTGSVGPALGTYNQQLSSSKHTLNVASGAVYLENKLVWDTVLNDIDLFAFDPSGTQAMASQNMQALTLSATEGLSIDYPVAGSWTSEVRGWLNAPQSYTLTTEVYYPVKKGSR